MQTYGISKETPQPLCHFFVPVLTSGVMRQSLGLNSLNIREDVIVQPFCRCSRHCKDSTFSSVIMRTQGVGLTRIQTHDLLLVLQCNFMSRQLAKDIPILGSTITWLSFQARHFCFLLCVIYLTFC